MFGLYIYTDVQQAFNLADSNRDGRIDAEQLLEVATTIGMRVKSLQHAQALITKYGSRGWQKQKKTSHSGNHGCCYAY